LRLPMTALDEKQFTQLQHTLRTYGLLH